MRQLIGARVVHRNEHTALRDDVRHANTRPHLSAPRADPNSIAISELMTNRILRMDLDRRVSRSEPTKHGGLSCAGLRMPLRGGATTGQQHEREVVVRGFRDGSGLFEAEARSAIVVKEAPVLEEPPLSRERLAAA